VKKEDKTKQYTYNNTISITLENLELRKIQELFKICFIEKDIFKGRNANKSIKA